MEKMTPLEELSILVSEELCRRGMITVDWQDGMAVSHRLAKQKAVVEAATVIEWVLRTGKFKVAAKA